MDFIKGDIKTIYWKYLSASMASAVVTTIYSFVDTIAVGQSEGPVGAAAMAVINPMYAVTAFFSILCGVGGAVLYGNAKGQGKSEKANAMFSTAIALMTVITLLLWAGFALLHQPILTFFGADAALMPKVMEYAQWIIGFMPMFLFSMFLGAFIRNDGAPGLAMAAVIIGGCVNMVGDWLFVFPLGMGMKGAAIATVLGTTVQMGILCAHFFTKKCTLKLVKPFRVLPAIGQTFSIGLGSSALELGNVILAIIINNQIMRYGDTTALAVYGVVATISALFQALYNGVGQAIQPIVSVNCGAGEVSRVHKVWKISLTTSLIMSVAFTAIGQLFPKGIARLFMDVTPEVLAAAPGIIRPYFLVFLFMGITVLSTYHLQSVMHGKMSMVVAVLRSVALSGALMYVLPLFLDIRGVWLAMPLSELIVAMIALFYIHKRT